MPSTEVDKSPRREVLLVDAAFIKEPLDGIGPQSASPRMIER